MAVAFRAAGTAASANSGNISPGVPAGTAANDILILVVASIGKSSDPTVSGYTVIQTIDWSAHTQGVVVFGKRAGAGESAPTVVNNGTQIIARIAGYSGAITSGTAWESVAGHTTFAATITADTLTPSVDNCMIICCGGGYDGSKSGALTFGVFTGSSPSMTEEFDSNIDDGSGNSTSICLDDGLQGTAAATGSRTSTKNLSGNGGGFTICIKPPAAVVSRGYAYCGPLGLAMP